MLCAIRMHSLYNAITKLTFDKKMTQSKTEISEKPVCFVLMPIADVHGYEPGHFGRVYEHLLKPAIIAAGYMPVRADDTVKTDYIVVGIIQNIVESAMVLCDFSARNPNVMYELGIRHAFNKPVVLIRDKKTDKIFDIQGLRYTEYDESLRIDSVNKDIGKITSTISETAAITGKDMNSIVQLAGIKTAEVPAGQTISSDTKLLLSTFSNFERRLMSIESNSKNSMQANFVVSDRGIMLLTGREILIGEELFIDANELGVLIDVSRKKQSILIKSSKGEMKEYSASSPLVREISEVPF